MSLTALVRTVQVLCKSKDKLNILVLHSLGNPDNTVRFLQHHVFSISRYHPQHNFLFHDVGLPLPEYVKTLEFDVIILDVTLLCYRWMPRDRFETLLNDYSFVAESNAVKLAFPQDEYDCNEILDSWMCNWNVDVVFSVISSNWDLLYPSFSKIGQIKLGYTGYIDESLMDYAVKPFEARTIDIGYRARKLPPYFGRIGEIKWTIGRDVLSASANYGLHADIVLGDAGILLGEKWLEFINESKFTLGSNSGSSLLDRRGDIQRKVKSYLTQYPLASFDEVEAHCFDGLDGLYSFTAISPRVLEAALLNSCQILVEGDYSGIIRPWEHYIPIKSDASDFYDVIAVMRDITHVKKMINNCRTAILDSGELRSNKRAEKIMACTEEFITKKNIRSSVDLVTIAIQRYNKDMIPKYKRLWKKEKLFSFLVKNINYSPKLSYFLRYLYSTIRS